MAVTHGMAAAEVRPIRTREMRSNRSEQDRALLLTAAAAEEAAAVVPAAPSSGRAVMAVAADHSSKPMMSTLRGMASVRKQRVVKKSFYSTD